MQRSSNQLREGVTRRQFLKLTVGFSLLATFFGVAIPIVGYVWPPERRAKIGGGRVLVATRDEILPSQAKKVSIGGEPVLVINTGTAFKAFSAICTHLACIVAWNERGQFIQCPCHDGRFDTNGQVISGPPPAPLKEYAVAVEGNNIYVAEA
jgi:cytochrome b6-f complex iron-sulfur subunit